MLSAKSSRPVSTPTRTARGASTPVLNRVGFFGAEFDSTSRNDGGNCVFINHLGYGVTQKNNILIKGFNIALKLNPVNEIHRDRDMFFAQGIKKGVL